MDLTRFSDLLYKNIIRILLLLAIAVIYWVPIRISDDISIAGKIYPAKQWVLFAGSNGQIMNTQIDLVAGVSHVYQSREFTRGDDVRFKINPEILTKSIIQKNDTVGVIYSNETMMQLNAARRDLAVKEAQLENYLTGLKEEDILLAEKKLRFAEIDADMQQKEYDRQKELHEQDVIADQNFDNQMRMAQLKQAQVEINKAELESARTGEKPETIELVKAEIEKIKTRIDDLETKLEMQTIVSPITGIFQNSYAADTLMIIESMDELIIKMPVSLKDRVRVFPGQKVTSTVLGQKQPFESEVVHMSNHISVSGGRQTFIVTAAIKKYESELLPGVVFRGKMEAEKILLRDYVMGWFSFFNKWVE